MFNHQSTRVGYKKSKAFGLCGFVATASVFLFVSSVFTADTVSADEVVAAEETLATTTKAIENSDALKTPIDNAKTEGVTVNESSETITNLNEEQVKVAQDEKAAEIEQVTNKYKEDKAKYAEEKKQYDEDLKEYNIKKAQYDEKKAAYEEYQKQIANGTDAGVINTLQELTLKTEPDAHTVVSGDVNYLTQAGVDALNQSDYLARFDGDKVKDEYLTTTNPYSDTDDAWVALEIGKTMTVTSTNLSNSRFKDTAIAKIVREFTVTSAPGNSGKIIANVYRDPAKTIVVGDSTDSANPLTIKVVDHYYDAAGNEVQAVYDGNSIIAVNSLNHYNGIRYTENGETKWAWEDTKHIEKMSVGSNKFIPIPGSSVSEQNGEIYSVNDNQYLEHGSKFNGNDMGNVKGWDDETASNFYWGSGALRLYDNHYTFSVQGNSVGLNTVYWFAINTNIAFPQPPGEEPVKPSEPTEPEAPSVTVNKYAIISALPVEPTSVEALDVLAYGNVIVKYQDEEGNTLKEDREDTPASVLDTEYNTNEEGENPETIVKDGVTYQLVRHEGEETGKVIEGTIVVTYIYKPVTPETPEVPTTPEVPVTPEVPTTPAPQLPNTGTAGSLLGTVAAFLLSGFGVLGFKKKED